MQVQGGQGSDGGAPAPAAAAPAAPVAAAPAPAPAPAAPAAAVAAAPAAPAAAVEPVAPALPTRPDYIPEAYWDATTGAIKGQELGKVLQAYAERQAKVITDPSTVEFKTSLKDIDGSEITFNKDHPLLKAASTMAKERGWTSDDLNAMAELIVTGQISAKQADDAEYVSIGNGDRAKADQRLSAAITKGAAALQADEKGNPTDEAKAAMTRLFASVHTRADFETLEKLITGQAGPGAAAAGGNGAQIVDIAKRMYPNEGKKAG